jgi:hypothetical protein
MAALHTDVTEVGGVAERARVGELILSHYLPAEPDAVTDEEWADRASKGFSGRTRPATMASAGHFPPRYQVPARPEREPAARACCQAGLSRKWVSKRSCSPASTSGGSLPSRRRTTWRK